MSDLREFFIHVPVFVWPVLALVVWRAMRYARPRIASVQSIWIAPAIIGAFSLTNVARIGTTRSAAVAWVIVYAAGFGLGWVTLHRHSVGADHARRRITLPADWSFPPLLILFFAMRFWVGWRLAIEPGVERHLNFALTEIAVSAFIAGLFLGKAWTLWRKWRAAPQTALPPPV